MTLFKALKALKALEGKTVTLISHYGRNTINDTGTLKVIKTSVYPYNAFLMVNSCNGGFFAGAGTVIGDNGKEIKISLRS